MIRIGIVGCGTIGAKLAKYIDADLRDKAQVIAISDVDGQKTRGLAGALRSAPEILELDALIDAADLVIEAASAKVSFDIAKKAISAGKDVLVMSTGGLLKDYSALFKLAKEKDTNIYLPSGAICGLDGLKGAKFSKIERVTLRRGLRLLPRVLEAMEGFPANINVAATLSLCGIGSAKTKVKIIASPSATKNIHEVEVEGEFGRLLARTENVPSPDNPKTSYLAILSAIATLNGILERVKIGT